MIILFSVTFFPHVQASLEVAGADEGDVRVAFFLSLLILQWVLRSLFGTAIPAAVLSYRTAPSDLLRRIRYSFLHCFGWLLVLPGGIGAANFALVLVLDLRGPQCRISLSRAHSPRVQWGR